jgi:hypothetical protein
MTVVLDQASVEAIARRVVELLRDPTPAQEPASSSPINRTSSRRSAPCSTAANPSPRGRSRALCGSAAQASCGPSGPYMAPARRSGRATGAGGRFPRLGTASRPCSATSPRWMRSPLRNTTRRSAPTRVSVAIGFGTRPGRGTAPTTIRDRGVPREGATDLAGRLDPDDVIDDTALVPATMMDEGFQSLKPTDQVLQQVNLF